MNKWNFIKKVAEKCKQSQTSVNEVMNAMTEVLVTEVRDNGEEIVFQGLGTFKQKRAEARTCRNPRDGKTITTKPSRTVQFRPSSTIKVEDK